MFEEPAELREAAPLQQAEDEKISIQGGMERFDVILGEQRFEA
jgi:hypothetical protein